jgi:chromosome condensin MukBEF complex kleisin-like MukF subunit
MSADYTTLPGVDMALILGSQRLRQYRADGLDISVTVQAHVLDRLLDRRLELMAVRDAEAVWTA